MKYSYYLALTIVFGAFQMNAQDFILLSYGASYQDQVFYTLEDDSEVKVKNEDWHILLTALGTQDAGVHYNEATSFDSESLELYLAPTTNFEDDVDINDLVLRFYNPDSSWNAGAFNLLGDPLNPFDYGWGQYDPAKMSVVGSEVFVLRLRNGSYKKFQIEALEFTTYKLKWADLDGENEKTMDVDKMAYRNNDLLMIDILDEEVIPSPQNFDLLFTRYNTPLDDGQGGILDYVVTGVLSAPGVSVAQVDGQDPADVMWSDHVNDLDPRLDIIGQDWKEFDLSQFMWVVPSDRTYFVKDRKGDVWKIIFNDFEGSSTGNIVFTKEKVGTVSSVDQLSSIDSWLITPNPAGAEMNIIVESTEQQQATWSIVTPQGQIMEQWDATINQGLVTQSHDLGHFPAGTYLLVLSTKQGSAAQSFIKL